MQQLEDNQRTALAVLLCILVFLFWSQWFMANNPPQTRPAAVASNGSTDGSAVAGPVTTNNSSSASTNSATSGTPIANTGTPSLQAPTPAELKAAQSTTISNQKIQAKINHLGARLSSFVLKDYRDHLGADAPLEMVIITEKSPLPLGVYAGQLNDAHVEYQLLNGSGTGLSGDGTYQVPENGELALRFQGNFPNGSTITKTYTFKSGSYLFSLEVALSAPVADGSNVWVEWVRFVPTEDLHSRYALKHFIMLGENSKIRNVTPDEVTDTASEAGTNRWISFADPYFMASLLPAAQGQNTRFGKSTNSFFSRVGGTELGGSFGVYIGPKEYTALKALGHELDRSIDLGWFSFLAYPLLTLIRLFFSWLGNYGLAVILLTLLLKLAFLPLTKASFKSMKAMQDLQPEIQALRERIKDPTQLNQEMMGLYKKRGVNPMGGCLPIMIQIPVFLGLYNALLNSIEMRHAPFALWIKDLSAPEHLDIMGIGIPVMVLIMGASMFIQQWTTPTAADPQQKKIMMMMPVIFTGMFIVFPMPAGLVLYWLINNVISIIQQVYLRGDKKADPMTATAFASVAIFCFGYVLTLI